MSLELRQIARRLARLERMLSSDPACAKALVAVEHAATDIREATLRLPDGMPPVGASGALAVGPLVVEVRARRVTYAGRPVRLTRKEWDLLARLARTPHDCVTKTDLLRDVWGAQGRMRTRTVDSHASKLRRALACAGAEGWVENVWGTGYRLVSAAARDVEELRAA
ncbi:MAG: winged helix-turn-helix domain-containing protein [Actinomycetota bacterium]